ncbi:MAG TPA: Gfo/Idh/MocA family oxidoreductase [Verrucomicrobiota bacterium]|nr:Gfo/Idh/MocA family oxidoreductase [Verrucomicrobiota bacterium]HNU50073.1 Gfo/Idh/MocA family oxidoreductase [Verrucomicrobiota bacterium]
MKSALDRRAFLRRSSVAGAGLLVLSDARRVFAAEANTRLNIAGIGIGGQGRGNLDTVARLGENLVALCDVDQARAGDIGQKHPGAKRYTDFRRMFDEMDREIDAVVISTPDHTHAVAAVAAMQRGKHVYCEKPLTRTVHEARVLRAMALKSQVVTQMGNQGSASDALRAAVEQVTQGTLGEVREAHVWFDGGNGPLERPQETPAVPAALDWNLWLGPAEDRPYHPRYLPASWRGWRAFGSGIVGDFGCHTGNILFRALRLVELWDGAGGGGPGRVILRVQAWPSEVNAEGYPRSMRATVDVPARAGLPPVKLTLWAKERPPADLMLGHPQQGWGDLLVGSKGSLYSECPWNTRFTLLPEAKFAEFKSGPPRRLPRSPGHHAEWVRACKGQGKTFSSFEVGGPMTELLQLVNLATLVEGSIDYDIVSGRIVNHDRASALLHRVYRPGWTLG